MSAAVRSAASIADEPLSFANDPVRRPDQQESQCKATVLGVVGTIHKIADQLKGLQAAAKLARSVETVMKSINGGNTGAAAGFSNLLKGFSAASVLLSALNALVTLPEQISKAKEIYNIFKKAMEGNTEGLTVKNLLSQSGFWLKKLAEYIECATFLGNNLSFYQMGEAGQRLPIVKSFADGISSVITIVQKTWDIMDANKEMAKDERNISKWKGRLKWVKSARVDGNGWSYERISHTARKECLKAALQFHNEAIKTAVASKVPQDQINYLESDKENIKTTLFGKKITKVLKEKVLSKVENREKYIQEALKKIEKKLWVSGLAPESRQIILNVLHDKTLTPSQKAAKLQTIRGTMYTLKNLQGHQLMFGSYSYKRHPDIFAKQIFDSGLYQLPEGSSLKTIGTLQGEYSKEFNTWDSFKNNSWNKFAAKHKGVEVFKNSDAFDESDAFFAMRNFCSSKVKQWENMKTKQQNIIARSSMSIAFSIGIIALVSLGLTLSLSKSLPPMIVKNIPYALAGIGVAVSLIGIARFVVDEVKKDRAFDKAKVVAYDPLKTKYAALEVDKGSMDADNVRKRLIKMAQFKQVRLDQLHKLAEVRGVAAATA